MLGEKVWWKKRITFDYCCAEILSLAESIRGMKTDGPKRLKEVEKEEQDLIILRALCCFV